MELTPQILAIQAMTLALEGRVLRYVQQPTVVEQAV
jgi:hypothetical protein